MTRVSKLFAAMLVVPALAFAGPASAAGFGQIEGGNIYRVKNVTKGSDFVDPASADAGDTLMYRVRIHNPGGECLTNVKVKATLPQGANTTNVSTVTVSADRATTNNISDTATVNLSSAQTISYVSGSTQLLDANGAVMSNLADGILTNGVNIGSVCISVDNKRFVQFQAKVNVPTPPKVELACVSLEAKKISNVRYDFTATGRAVNTTIKSYVFTAKNSAGATVDTHTANTSATTAVYQFNQSTPGTYTVSVVVNSDKDSATSSACVKQVTVEAAPTPPPAPTPPTPPQVQGKTTEELPNTGAGSVISLFAGASVLGAAGHYALRRFRG